MNRVIVDLANSSVGRDLGIRSSVEWQVLSETSGEALIGQKDPHGMFVLVRLDGSGQDWRVRYGNGGCTARLATSSSVALPFAVASNGSSAESSKVAIVLTGPGCASDVPMADRVTDPPVVEEGADRVMITVWAMRSSDQTGGCRLEKPHAVEVSLSKPLGARAFYDGGSIPVASVPSTGSP